MSLIYLDNNATTMMDPRVCEAMLPFLREAYANPSSVHHFGQQARHAVDSARARIAAALGTEPRRIALVSGGTEANNLAIRGTLAVRGAKRHFVTTAVEHESVRRLGGQLAKEGYRVTCVGVDGAGRIDPDAFAAALTEETALASVIHANNETGVVFPVEVLGRIAAEKGVPLHVDATQAVGKLPVDFSTLPVQLASWSGHKFHGPKGIGGLYVARGARLRSQIVGGHQEHDLRGGHGERGGHRGDGGGVGSGGWASRRGERAGAWSARSSGGGGSRARRRRGGDRRPRASTLQHDERRFRRSGGRGDSHAAEPGGGLCFERIGV